MDDRIQSVIIPCFIAKLKEAGIAGVDDYGKKLKQNARIIENLKDFLMEAHAAFMFSHYGFTVTMRESPDLRIVLDNETVYAEVKHFREKEQDRTDQEAMEKSEDLVAVGILPPNELCPWQQIANRAIKYEKQYVENAPNLLVLVSDSNAVGGSVLETGVVRFNQMVATSDANSPLRRLSAVMLVDEVNELWTGQDLVNVYFCPTALGVPMILSAPQIGAYSY